MSETTNTLEWDLLSPGNVRNSVFISSFGRPVSFFIITENVIGKAAVSINRGDTIIHGGVAAIPEPSTLLLMATGLAVVVRRTSRRR
ncbi:MAG: PEP-CTERM sorting domain-containing protein [Pyrinomonadaceae bacterium]|nr:PEP-CTERM sorting domain-containing protein [Pyrinomonadaceae bacterium]